MVVVVVVVFVVFWGRPCRRRGLSRVVIVRAIVAFRGGHRRCGGRRLCRCGVLHCRQGLVAIGALVEVLGIRV